jgi:transcriptional pleiotropic regulator of transition state genes
MKNTGITRPLDDLGRVVLPKELRTQYDLHPKDQVEIYTTEEGILIKKYQPSCILCGGYDSLKVIHGHKICIHCRQVIKEEG